MFYPISAGEIINVVAFVDTPGARGTRYEGPWATATTTEEVEQQFAGWDMITQTLIKVSGYFPTILRRIFADRTLDWQSIAKPTLWAVHTVAHLPTYVKGRAILLGDAVSLSTTLCGWISTDLRGRHTR